MQREGQKQMSSRGERTPSHHDCRFPIGRERDIYACPVRWERKSFTPTGPGRTLMRHAVSRAWFVFLSSGFAESTDPERVRS